MRTLIFLISLVGLSQTLYAVENISPDVAAELVTQGLAELIDVRERSELEATGIAAPALWLPKSEVDKGSLVYVEFVEQLDSSKTLIFYCRTGQRAEVVAKHFATLGFKTKNMGGFDGWVNADLPVLDFDL